MFCESQQYDEGKEPPSRKKRKDRTEASSHHNEGPKLKRHRLTVSNLRRHDAESDADKVGRTGESPTGGASDQSSTTTISREFGECLQNNNVIYESSFTKPPDDCDRLRKALLKKRQVPASAHKNWERMRLNIKHMAYGERSLESMVIEAMLTRHDCDAPYNYSRYRKEEWTEVDNKITSGISIAKPDVTESHLWSAYPVGTMEEFDDLVVSEYGYAMPTFAMESKGLDDFPNEAVKQAAYAGAIMTHAALAVDSILGRRSSMKYRRTKAITVTLDKSEITAYADHAVLIEKAGKEETHYHQHPIVSVRYMKSRTEWERAHTMLYNAQRIGLRLANLRIKAIQTYFEEKKLTQAELKAKHAKLQKQVRAKSRATMTATSQTHTPSNADDELSSIAHHISKKRRSERSSAPSPETDIMQNPPTPVSETYSGTSSDVASI